MTRAQQAVLDGFADILGLALSKQQTAQAGLPISVGGCGLRCPEVQKPAARLAALSTFYTRSAQDIGLPEYGRQVIARWVLPPIADAVGRVGPNCDPLVSWQGNVQLLQNAEPSHTQQKWWADLLSKAAAQRLQDGVSPRDQALLLEQSNSYLNSFMSVPPPPAFTGWACGGGLGAL